MTWSLGRLYHGAREVYSFDLLPEEGHKMPAADRMQHYDAYIDPNNHQVQQTIYLARRNPKPSDETDHYEIISQTTPEEK